VLPELDGADHVGQPGWRTEFIDILRQAAYYANRRLLRDAARGRWWDRAAHNIAEASAPALIFFIRLGIFSTADWQLSLPRAELARVWRMSC
jgi:hypothetical protein